MISKMDELVSIIVPIYKVPEVYLSRCIESLQNQTHTNIEIILVDDGSPDYCGALCEQYALSDSRIVVIHKENEGLAAARNTGYLASKGEWFSFVDGDDWIEADMCTSMLQATRLAPKDIQVVLCGVYRDTGRQSEVYKINLLDGAIYRGKECAEVQCKVLRSHENIADAWAKLFRHSFVVEHHLLHNEKLLTGAEGAEFVLRVLDVVDVLTFVEKPLYHYIYNAESTVAKQTDKSIENIFSAFEAMFRFLQTSDNKEELERLFHIRMAYITVSTAISGYFHPDREEGYWKRRAKMKEYLNRPIVRKALSTVSLNDMTPLRGAAFFMLRFHCFFVVQAASFVRKRLQSYHAKRAQ